MPLYGMQTPNGYSWMAEPWVSTGALVSRMNFAIALSSNRVGGAYVDWTTLLNQRESMEHVSTDATSAATAKESRLESLLLGQPASEQTRSTVIAQLNGQEAQQQAEREFGIRTREGEPMWAVLNAAAPAGSPRAPLDHDAAVMGGLLLGSPEFQRR